MAVPALLHVPGSKAAKKPEEKTQPWNIFDPVKRPLVCDNNLWRWRARAYLQNARVEREAKDKKIFKTF